jgi:hypothetical protein
MLRWLIRVPCLLALAFVVGVGVTSYFWGIHLIKVFGGRYWTGGVVEGLAYVSEDRNTGADTPLTMYFNRGVTAKGWLPLTPPVLGFYGGGVPGWPDALEVVFPLWLPAVVLGLGNWWVWRKTRWKRAGRGFPVELIERSQSPAEGE